MRSLCIVLFMTGAALADKPALAPAYVAPAAPAPDSYGSPVAAPSQDSYGSPVASPVAAPAPAAQDSYGSPQAPVVDSYGSPQAPAQTSYQEPQAANPAPVGNQGYYYYYYPVKQQQQAHAQEEDDGGLLGGLGGLLSAILGKKILVIALGIAGFLVLVALGVNITGTGGRSLDDITARVMPYMTEDNMDILTDLVQTSINAYQNL